MKFTGAIVASLLATGAAAFDKYQRTSPPTLYPIIKPENLSLTNYLAWGKRDYACVNVYQGIPDNSTVAAGQTVHLRFNRAPTTHCSDPLAQYPGSNYTVFLYNNPVRNLDTIHFDAQIKIAGDVPESAGKVDVKIPKDLPQVKDGSVWYLRLSTGLVTAPQVSYNFALLILWLSWLAVEGFRGVVRSWIGLTLVNTRCLLCTTLPDRLRSPLLRSRSWVAGRRGRN